MTIIEALVDLQEVDGRIRELEHELKDLPRRKALETARLSGAIADLQAAKANQEYASQRVKGYEEDAQALKEKIQKLKTTQMGLKTNKEYQDLTWRRRRTTRSRRWTTCRAPRRAQRTRRIVMTRRRAGWIGSAPSSTSASRR